MFQYTVQPGDSLYHISVMHNVPLEAILAVNPGLSPTNLMIGQTIMIPAFPHGEQGIQNHVHYHVHHHIHQIPGPQGTTGMPGPGGMTGMPGTYGMMGSTPGSRNM